ncbi:MAG: SBBP repeat-containing protein [Phycisphaerae bacterium]|nr:SBBP repeat-containing protein [Phycisphaerae bacterium]
MFKVYYSVSVVLSVFLLLATAAAEQTVSITRNIASMPLAFTENQGQWDERVLYRANAGGATMWFTADGAYYQFTRRIPNAHDTNPPQEVGHQGEAREAGLPVTLSGVEGSGAPQLAVGSERFSGRQMPSSAPDKMHQPDSIETMMIKASFVGANPDAAIEGIHAIEYKCNYFLGNDPDKWRTDVPNYQAIVYEEVYPGIDLKYYGNGKQMEYDFIVSPGADYSQIQVQYDGIRSLSISGSGELVVEIDWCKVTGLAPFVYQVRDGARKAIQGEYQLVSANSFSFVVGDAYDPNLPLVIDPVELTYSTFLGGMSDEWGLDIAIDGSGCAYVTGDTWSSDFPTQNAYDAGYSGNSDVFVTKLSAAGNALLYSTFLGGGSVDYESDITVDGSGCAYVTGETWSSDFPTLNAYDSNHNGDWDAFVTKLSAAGNALLYSTFLGGASVDFSIDIAVDGSGCAYVTGRTESPDFPTQNAYDGSYNGYSDVFVTKLSAAGNSLLYSTFLGGTSYNCGSGIAVDGSGCAYVSGDTWSSDFPTQNAYDSIYNDGGSDVFVTRLSTAGNSLLYSTFLGGTSADFGWGDIAVDGSGCAYVTGYTYSPDFPTQNAYDGSYNGYSDVFVTKLSATGNSLLYSTFLGGTNYDVARRIAIDNSGCAYVTGDTESPDFPTQNAYDASYNGDKDVFVTKFSAAGNLVLYSTFLGGASLDIGFSVAVNDSGCAYVTGYTASADFPTENPYQTYQGDIDVFVTKLCESCCAIRGDVDHSGILPIDIADLVYLVDYMFNEGPEPPCWDEGDVDASGVMPIDIADLVYLVDYMFNSGPEPPPCS